MFEKNFKLNKRGGNFYLINVDIENKGKFLIVGNVVNIFRDKIEVAFNANKNGLIIDSIFVYKNTIISLERIDFEDLMRV